MTVLPMPLGPRIANVVPFCDGEGHAVQDRPIAEGLVHVDEFDEIGHGAIVDSSHDESHGQSVSDDFPSAPGCGRQRNAFSWGGDAEGGAPYQMPDPRDPAKIIGFEVDIADALGKRLGMEPRFVQQQWDGLVPGLQRGEYDAVIAGLEITPERLEKISFLVALLLLHPEHDGPSR